MSDYRLQREIELQRETASLTKSDMDGLRADLAVFYKDLQSLPRGLYGFALWMGRVELVLWALAIIGLAQTALLAWIVYHMH
jgi:hypothetical protein